MLASPQSLLQANHGAEITELLGGGIQVQSEVGKGTTFYFFIRATANTAPTTELRSVTSNSTLASISITTPSIAPSVTRHSSHDSQSPGSEDPDALAAAAATATFHVLIVEDNIINQTVLRRQVLKAGLTCDVADNGQEALVAIHEAHRRARLGTGTGYDVVLMDLEMPIMDGLTALKHLRDAEEAGSLSRQLVIALTGNARQGQIDQAISAGMDDGELQIRSDVGRERAYCRNRSLAGRHEWRVPAAAWRRAQPGLFLPRMV